jgi:hypothetical protein
MDLLDKFLMLFGIIPLVIVIAVFVTIVVNKLLPIGDCNISDDD